MVGAFIAGIYGLIVGSFLNVVVGRLQEKRSIVYGRSSCDSCKHELGWFDLVPVFSWLFLRGKCRYCKTHISAQYPMVELVTGILFAISYTVLKPVHFEGWFNFVIWLYLLSSLIVLAVYDWLWMLLPNSVLLPAIVIAFEWVLIKFWYFNGPVAALTGPILAAVIAGLIFSLMAMIARGRLLGFGDVKLVLLMGLLLGLRRTALGLFLAFNLAAIISLILMALRKKTRKDYIAFGPFLVMGTIIAYLYGTPIITWYMQITGLNTIWH